MCYFISFLNSVSFFIYNEKVTLYATPALEAQLLRKYCRILNLSRISRKVKQHYYFVITDTINKYLLKLYLQESKQGRIAKSDAVFALCIKEVKK